MGNKGITNGDEGPCDILKSVKGKHQVWQKCQNILMLVEKICTVEIYDDPTALSIKKKRIYTIGFYDNTMVPKTPNI